MKLEVKHFGLQALYSLSSLTSVYGKDELFQFHKFSSVIDYFGNYYINYNAPNKKQYERAERVGNFMDTQQLNWAGIDGQSYCDWENKGVDGPRYARQPDGTCNSPNWPFTAAKGASFRKLGETKPTVANIMDPDPYVVAKDILLPNSKYQKTCKTDKNHGQVNQCQRIHVESINLATTIWLQFMLHDWLMISKKATKEKEIHGLYNNDLVQEWAAEQKKKDPNWERNQNEKFTDSPDIAYLKSKATEYAERYVANNNTHWWDSSMIYGSEEKSAAKVRSDKDGKLLPDGKIRLSGPDGVTGDRLAREEDYPDNVITGFNDNMWTGLEWLHVVWHKEHNHIVDELKKQPVPEYMKANNKAWTDDDGGYLYNVARNLVSNLINKVHAIEWTPILFDNVRSTNAQRGLWGLN